jgi:molybdate transport system substrate-binding protein
MKRTLLLLVALLAARARADEPRELTVYAAASLKEVLADLGKAFEARTPGVKVRFNLAGSQELRAQIEHGAKADLFLSADEKHMAALEKAGLVGGSRVFAHNQPVVVVPKGNPTHINAFADLPKGQRIVIGGPEVPIGNYTLQILDRAGKEFKERVLERVVSRELNVRQVLAKVTLGEADAAIVYRTDAAIAKDKVEVIAIPTEINIVSAYPAAVLKDAPQAETARAFLDFLLSADGQKRLAAAGFTP